MASPSSRPFFAEPQVGAVQRGDRVRWLRERFAAGRYPLSPALIASEILCSGRADPPPSPDAKAYLVIAIARLSPEQVRLLQAVFVDHVPMTELAQALRVPPTALWQERQCAILTLRLALLAQTLDH